MGYCSESYDSVVHIDESDWLKELVESEPSKKMGINSESHFAIYFSSNGYFETIAEEFKLQTSERGLLEANT